ncbi:MAG: phosphate ABC transporter substrate-binding protein [Candidatus Omnitrophica bacterium]|nr:phosphate ABC transporter substrate-binding protein [Candidatus Omnitrophota bacterium]
MNKPFTAVLLVAALCLGAAVTPAEAKNSIQIKGSDTMVNLGQAWAEAFNRIRPEVNVAVTGGGSGTGIAALLSGTCDICESSRAMEPRELKVAEAKGIAPKQEIVALDGIAVVVHPANPVKDMTIDQLRGIFMGDIKNWKDVGGKNIPIVILSREVNSGTHLFFKEHVLRRGVAKGPEEFSPFALLMPSSQAIADEVTNNENAIGYYGMGYISPAQKVIAVAKDASSPFVKPTIENVKANTYPISRPLYIFTNGEPKGVIRDFMDFAFSKEGQEIVRKTDFVPVR